MITCTKRYSDIPFAHRQHMHDGHCAWIHGHNWDIEVTFNAYKLDECGFVVDFGKLKFLKEWIEETLDHSLLLNRDDPELEALRRTFSYQERILARICVVEDCSSEGIAKWIHEVWDPKVQFETGGRAWITKVTIFEDSKNSATFYAE